MPVVTLDYAVDHHKRLKLIPAFTRNTTARAGGIYESPIAIAFVFNVVYKVEEDEWRTRLASSFVP